MIDARDLHLTFAKGTPLENHALRGMSVTLEAGEFVTVIQHCPVRFLHEQFPGFVDSACQADRVAFVIH